MKKLNIYYFPAQLMATDIEANRTTLSLEAIVRDKIHKLCETYQKKEVMLNTRGSTSSNAIGK